jgi:ParB family chromosome partitioning protein
MKNPLAIPDEFTKTALAFPGKVERVLATITDVWDAKGLLDKAETMAQYAKRIKADDDICNSIQYGKLLIVDKLGDMLKAKSKRGKAKKGTTDDTLFPKQTASRFRKVHRFKRKIGEYREAAIDTSNGKPKEIITLTGFIRFATGTEKAGAAAHVSENTGVPEWYTPSEYIEAARVVLGRIDLDPASSKIAQKTVRAIQYFSIDDDGLAQAWAGRVWLNPPYTSDLVVKFVGKLCGHFEASEVSQAILLVNNATETQWFQQAAGSASALCFPAGRIKFLDENGKPGAPLQGQSILYMGKHADKFVAEFKGFGFCCEVRK